MTKQDLEKIADYIIHQGMRAISQNTDEADLPVDYLGIFSKDENEFIELDRVLRALGKPGDSSATKTGSTYVLHEPMSTPAGPLTVIKVRKPDPTRPQRGAPDFRVPDYQSFKEKYLSNGPNFSLMIRTDYEMLELKGVDVLVYFPSKSFDERQSITS